jgi:hypothetical protein
MLLATYIVRLYRFQKNKPRSLMGVVEEVGAKGKKAFTNYDELWEILNYPKGVKSASLRPSSRGERVGMRGKRS